MNRRQWNTRVLAVAAVPALAFAALTLGGADRGLSVLSGQAVSLHELHGALAYLAAYAAFVLFTPPLVLSVFLEPLIAKLLPRRDRKA